ncbi:phytoene/squalene synthase family protein [Kordiimonas aquimaris]|uniref:phytoene/squalene synthase family protein n=1 Tax=Kordiimonas aquimaris TaxID=707591 RepID=UPI0021D1D5C1|nr:squalene/phytoene synthase family protein [Kordiimonas aquimaris]
MDKTSANNSYCRDMVRADDRARYDTTLFAPRHQRAPLWALYAFNQEVAKTRESVSESALGEIRLQWWQDAIEELKSGNYREHPVVAEMKQHLTEPAVLKLMSEIVSARKNDMYDDGPADTIALATYARSVGGALSEAAVRVCAENSEHLDADVVEAARKSGSAWAMIGLVRAIPFHWAANRNFVPGDDGKAALATTSAEKMYELAASSISEMITYAKREQEASAKLANDASAKVKHIFLLNALSNIYLKNMAAAGNNPFKYQEPTDLKRMWSLMKASIIGW